MMTLKKPLAIALLAAMTACTGGPTAATPPAPPAPPVTGVPLVGVGDSLTAGYQSGGFLGDTTATSTFSNYPGGAVPPGQENGFWMYLYSELTGTTGAALYNPATSPQPLIKAPGLGNQLVLNAASLFAGSQGLTGGCSLFNLQGFSSAAWASTRLSTTNTVTDLGVPGITMHEAVAMSGPLTGPPPNAPSDCTYPSNPADLTAGGLQSLVAGESELFYPVLGGYQTNFPGSTLTELNVAVALRPKLATVWLGANDLLKFIFSNGKSPISEPSGAAMGADLTQIVNALTATGAKVLVADLPNVLTTPQFFPVASASNPNKLVGDFVDLLVTATAKTSTPLTPGQATTYASGIVPAIVTAYCGPSPVLTQCYLTETGFLTAVKASLAAIAANPAAPPFSTYINLDASPCGSGAVGSGAGGCYITPTFAAQINGVNNAYNAAIDAVANGSGPNVALVPITNTFTTLAVPGNSLTTLVPGAPALTLAFGGGLLSWDGLHPSNAGYAAIANVFIGTAITKFGLPLVPLTAANFAQIAYGVPSGNPDPYNPTVVNAALGGTVFPLP